MPGWVGEIVNSSLKVCKSAARTRCRSGRKPSSRQGAVTPLAQFVAAANPRFGGLPERRSLNSPANFQPQLTKWLGECDTILAARNSVVRPIWKTLPRARFTLSLTILAFSNQAQQFCSLLKKVSEDPAVCPSAIDTIRMFMFLGLRTPLANGKWGKRNSSDVSSISMRASNTFVVVDSLDPVAVGTGSHDYSISFPHHSDRRK